MKNVYGFYLLAMVCALTGASALPTLATEIALVPVGASVPHIIVGNEITVGAGSNVIFEIHVSGWADPNPVCNGGIHDGAVCTDATEVGDCGFVDPLTGVLGCGTKLRAYQMELDSATYSSGTQGAMTPARVPCLSDTTCIEAFGGACSFGGEACTSDTDCEFFGFGDVCRGPTCTLFVDGGAFCMPAFIANKQAGFIFKGFLSLDAVDVSTLAIRFGSAIQGSASLSDPGFVTYAGTLVLEVPADALGTFTVGFAPSPDTLLLGADNALLEPTALTPARIVIGDVGCASDLDCDDGNLCTDDACFGGACAFTPNFVPSIACCNPGTGFQCGRTRGTPGDASRDGVVDLSDFGLLQNCFGLDPFPAECITVDVDCHCNVGLADIAGFASVLNGP